jgi:hypothetical protein
MRTKRIVLGLALSAGCGIAIQAASAEEYRGTFEQQRGAADAALAECPRGSAEAACRTAKTLR